MGPEPPSDFGGSPLLARSSRNDGPLLPPEPPVISAEAAQVFEKFITTEYAYFTPKGEPLCWPVSPYWYPERGVLAIATGLGYPNKAIYAKRNRKVAMYFSDPTGSGLSDPPRVLVQGDAVVLDDDIQANTDRYVTELRNKFAAAKVAINPLTVKLLDFYLPRLWVEVTPRRILMAGEMPAMARGLGSAPLASRRDLEAIKKLAPQFSSAVAVVKDDEGYPFAIRTSVEFKDDRLVGAPPTLSGPGAVVFHHHTLRGTRFQAYMVRGTFATEGVFDPSRLVGFFGNGLFPLSVLGNVTRLRRRIREELGRRDQPMPKLRVP